MIGNKSIRFIGLLTSFATAPFIATAAPNKAEPTAQLSATGKQLEAKYASTLASLKSEIAKALPNVSEQKRSALKQAQEDLKKAEANAASTQEPMAKVREGEALVAHAKGKWIGGAEKGIAEAEAALKKATTDAQRDAAKKDLAKWQANKADGLKALEERQAALDKAKADLAKGGQASSVAQAALTKARASEQAAVNAVLAAADTVLSSDKLDAKLLKGAILAESTPKGLAEFAQMNKQAESLVEKLLADEKLIKEMLVAGGANGGKYGQAMEIYTAIQQASPKAKEGVLQRLALATGLEFAVPIRQSNASDETKAPAFVDPVKRYLHYEKAFLAGELDPAFKGFNTWEYRMVLDCDAPDEILTWGREMLKTYRPDHVMTPDYGWRYSAAVKTEVKYGSENVSKDLPSLNDYQNIPKNGGVCGRRAFFGRFMLRSFGIPVWGVTQHKHAALSHWTPKGWVINLGAGFHASWWDKDDAPRSGSDFLLEAQAREHGQDFLKVLRAQWVSRILGEQAFNDRKKVSGDFWSSTAHFVAVKLASQAVELGPLGQELGEANESKEKQNKDQAPVAAADQQIQVNPDGSITIPAVAHGKATGSKAAMKSFSGGMQMFCSGGFKTQYAIPAPQAGKYLLTARVATLQEGQKFVLSANDAKSPVEIAVPYTIGLWQQTPAVEISLNKGGNVLNFELPSGIRGATIKEFTLKPSK